MTDSRYDFPDKIVRVTAGKGSAESYLVFAAEKTVLMECGMAYCHRGLTDNIHKALKEKGRSGLDYIALSHSHYDHVGALPYVLDEWPDAKVIAAEKARKVFQSEGAKKTITRLLSEAARNYGAEQEPYDADKLKVDIVVGDNDVIDLGAGEKLMVLETKGHTDCSLTYVLEPDRIMFSSESTGVIRAEGVITSAILKSYKQAVESAKKCMAYKPDKLITPHYGMMTESEKLSFFIWFLIAAEREKDYILDSFDRSGSVEGAVDLYEKRYWSEDWLEGQPKAAFMENANATVRNVLKEFGRI